MSDARINEQILKWIREHSKNDKAIENFLIDLIYEEAEHPRRWWWWKDTYKKKIKKYSEESGDSDEN